MSLIVLDKYFGYVRIPFTYMISVSRTISLVLMWLAFMVHACAWAASQNTPPPPEPEIITYRNPIAAMMDGYYEPAEIELLPGWGLSEKQKVTASQPPRPEAEGKRGYIYPEDVAPTAEQIAEGSALSPRQRQLMRKARKHARLLAAWHSRKAAEKYNKDHSAELAVKEKQGIYIVIHLKKQRGVCMEGEKVLRQFRVCSGKKSTPTPKGHFHIIEKKQKHNSNLYNNAPMPFFMRLTVDGVGLHQGKLRSWPASHGCIRLSWDDARFLFNKCPVGTAVFVEN